ncbi:MAG: lipopolysaccharide heptosyltransferase family protein [Bacteroidetes bacterium]|nr:MAG: lipopolysaccharide heptosyltransferase family protein [Bacteroidota bacterium]TAG89201.1 MAG: lipopolysaccharide heptosyltransferase family protein [Bacteroidota bacterium]
MPHILIVKIDAIGDYILFRNFLSIIRESQKFKGYHITFLGNEIYKDLAVAFDKDVVDDFIWLNRKKFSENRLYRWKFLWSLKTKKYDILVNPTFSRNFYFDDEIAKNTRAKVKIAQEGDKVNSLKASSGDKYYSILIQPKQENFEFYKNRAFISEVLQENISINIPTLPTFSTQKENVIIFFPSASEAQKRWKPDNFVSLAKLILSKYKVQIKIVGSPQDISLGEYISEKINNTQVENMAGKTSLSELTYLLSESKLLISNDTGAIHIASAVKTKTICLYKGDHFGRFQPYPNEINQYVHTIFSKRLKYEIDNNTFDEKNYHSVSSDSLETILPEDVFDIINDLKLISDDNAIN